MTRGTPKVDMKVVFQNSFPLIERRGNAAGYLVFLHITVNKLLLPFFALW